MDEHQVIVVGAGPAGAACAKALKDKGIDVLVIEKDELPRHKTCSGILFGQTQVLLKKLFGTLPPKDVYCRPEIIKATNVRQWNKEKGFSDYPWEIPKDGQEFPQDYHNIWRNRFDHWLMKQSGAPYRKNCTLLNYSLDDDKIKVEILQKDKTRINASDKGNAKRELHCSYLIGADGGTSRVRKIHDPAGCQEMKEVVIYQTYNRFSDMGSLKDDHWNVFFEPSVGDMISCVHRKDDYLTLCVGGFKGRNLKAGMETLKEFISDNFAVVFEEEERVEGCILRPAPPDLGRDRVILIGDAAGLIYLNGEGISAAIDSGFRAGDAVAQALQEGTDAAAVYKDNSADILNHMNNCMEQMHFLIAE